MPQLRREKYHLVPVAPSPHFPSPGSLLDVVVRGNGQTLGELPQPMLCWVALYGGLQTTGRLLRTQTWLLSALQVDCLWYHLARSVGCTRPVADTEHGWQESLGKGLESPVRHVNWQQLIQQNMQLHGQPYVWLQICDMELRIMISSGRISDVLFLFHELRKILPRLHFGPGKRDDAAMVCRLRRRQWRGRPGSIPQVGSLVAGARLMCECAEPASSSWQLPPFCGTAPSPNQGTSATRGMPFLSWPWSLLSSKNGDDVGGMMIRVVSLLVPRALYINAGTTVGSLFEELSIALRLKSTLLCDLGHPLEFQIMHQTERKTKLVLPKQTLLREIFWVQSETIFIELESDDHRLGRRRARALSLLIYREEPFSQEQDKHLSNETKTCSSLDDLGILDTCGSTWGRQVSEPTVGSELDFEQPAFQRQVSDPLASGRHRPRLQQNASLNVGRRNRNWAAGHPGDQAAEFPPDGELQESLSEDDGRQRERILPHYPPVVVPHSARTRQFEFHPSLSDVILTGDKEGNVNILKLNSEEDEWHTPLHLGKDSVLALSWLHHHPQIAMCGASHSGMICCVKYDPQAAPNTPAMKVAGMLEDFPKLSSLNVNCTDDFMVVSGISQHVAIYDVPTSRLVHRAEGVHEHLINISRFCHSTPHILATASFDHTCRIWDLRIPMQANKAVKTLNCGGHNVMCAFSPDDKYLLCSGVDTRITQFEVPSWRRSPEKFPLPNPIQRERYRRSMYLSSSQAFITAATEESHMHILSVTGYNYGVVDFRGVIRAWKEQKMSRNITEMGTQHRTSPKTRGRSLATQDAPELRSDSPQSSLCRMDRSQQLVHGTVQLDEGGREADGGSQNGEFIQSLRAHPTIGNQVGVLLSGIRGDHSVVALVDFASEYGASH